MISPCFFTTLGICIGLASTDELLGDGDENDVSSLAFKFASSTVLTSKLLPSMDIRLDLGAVSLVLAVLLLPFVDLQTASFL